MPAHTDLYDQAEQVINVSSMFYVVTTILIHVSKCDDQLTYNNFAECVVPGPTTDLHHELRIINYCEGLNSLNYCPA